MTGPFVPSDDVVDKVEKVLAIFVIVEDGLAGHAACRDVIGRTSHLQPKRTCHGRHDRRPIRPAVMLARDL
jgi:hypothetical protein